MSIIDSLYSGLPSFVKNSKYADYLSSQSYNPNPSAYAPVKPTNTVAASSSPKVYRLGPAPSATPGSAALSPEQQANLLQYQSDNSLAAIEKQIAALQNPAVPPPPTLPNFNPSEVFKQAQEVATSNVSPYYETLRQNFEKRLATMQDRAQQDLGITQANAYRDLGTTLEGNRITGERTAADVATNIGDINQNEQNAQYDSAQSFNNAYGNLRSGNAAAGLTFSGLGQKKEGQALQTKQIAEGRQTAQTQSKVKAQELYKTRTFEDLARSGELSKTAAADTAGNAKINFDRTSQDLLDQSVQDLRNNEINKQQSIQQQTPLAAQEQFLKYMDTLNPEQKIAAQQQYGSYF